MRSLRKPVTFVVAILITAAGGLAITNDAMASRTAAETISVR